MILCIETATEVCSAALCHDGKTISLVEDKEGRAHASKLTPLIKCALESASVAYDALDAVAVSMGPGSYTGLRIGVSVAKGISFALKIPLIGIGTLDAMYHGFLKNHASSYPSSALFCPMIDARRMEVFNAVYNFKGERIREVSADIIDQNSYNEFLSDYPVVFFGNGASKCSAVLKNPNAIFFNDFLLSASFLAELSEKALKDERFEDVAYFEPYYLKDFIATVPKNQLLSKRKEGK
jgi:tRNA threonylcarbamoyladenosine biosynthesis protein TsaB